MVYLVEDDENVRNLAIYALRHAGIHSEGAANDVGFRELCSKKLPDVVVLDVMLPGTDGIEILRRIRRTPGLSRVPVMMATAKNAELDIVSALDAGADEYITKPYGMMELVSRVRALLRRVGDWSTPADNESALVVGPISVVLSSRLASCEGKELELTMREFDLLAYLMQNAGEVFSRDALLKNVWGWDFSGGSRTVDMHVLTLRQKLGNHADMIETVRGVGYRLVKDADEHPKRD